MNNEICVIYKCLYYSSGEKHRLIGMLAPLGVVRWYKLRLSRYIIEWWSVVNVLNCFFHAHGLTDHYKSTELICSLFYSFNGHERNMRLRHLTAAITELIARTSSVRPTGVSKCGSYIDTFRALSGKLSCLSL